MKIEHSILLFFLLFMLLLIPGKDKAAVVFFPGNDNNDNTDNTAINDNDKNNLKILSWNIYMLPKMVMRNGKVGRARAIVDALKNSDFDIIVFEEAFLPSARKIISKGLDSLYPYHYGPANNTHNIKSSSGVWVISKVKMKILKTIRFKECASWDCLVRKGAVLLEGAWHGKTFQLLGTHLQADEHQQIRYAQMDEIYNDLLSPYRRDGIPQLICGDMNTEAEINERYCKMLDCFGAENGDISGVEKYTYDVKNNEIAKWIGPKNNTTYDYILVRKNGSRIKAIRRFVNVLRKGKKNLSDHYGIVCELKF